MRTTQQEIIRNLGVEPVINPAQEIERRTEFLSSYLAQAGLNGFTLGISGGQDSLLAGLLAQRAVERQRAAGNKVAFHAVLLPYGEQIDRDDALLACDTIQPDTIHDLDIRAGVDGFSQSYNTAENSEIADFDKGNVKARMRMIAQYAIAGKERLLVVGTDHAAEAVSGFFTKYGDGGADILPLSGLTKRQGKALLRELGAPERFITKAPSADLLDTTPQQTDETELDITYETLDDYLEGISIADPVAEKIEQRYWGTEHKRQLPVSYSNVARKSSDDNKFNVDPQKRRC